MTEIPAGLALYRAQLRDAIAQQDSRVHRRGRQAVAIGVPGAAAIAAGVLALTLGGGTSVSSADAAILHRVEAALTTPPAMILHERAMVTLGSTTSPYELWQVNLPPYDSHVLKWGHQDTGPAGRSEDFAAALRGLVRSGHATVDGRATVNGVAAYRLTIRGASDRFLNGTAYVAQSNYHPLELDTTALGGERIVFQTYEYVPATPALMRSLGLAAR
jgi:hypothetical protein